MTNIERPDLDKLDPAVRAYIESLEAELERLRQHKRQERGGFDQRLWLIETRDSDSD